MICLRRLHYSLQMWTLQCSVIWSKFSELGHGSTSTLICPLVVYVVSNVTSAGLISCTMWRGASLFLSARWPLLLWSPYSCSKFHKYWKHIFKDLDMDFLPSSCTTLATEPSLWHNQGLWCWNEWGLCLWTLPLLFEVKYLWPPYANHSSGSNASSGGCPEGDLAGTEE